jgi:two-component system, sensor histidine kinase and response regulator
MIQEVFLGLFVAQWWVIYRLGSSLAKQRPKLISPAKMPTVICGQATTQLVKTEPKQLFKSLVENIPGVIFRCKVDDRLSVHYINHSIIKMTGYPVSKFLGPEAWTIADLIHPEDRLAATEFVKQACSSGYSYVHQYRVIKSNSEIRTLEERGQPVRDESGDVWIDGVLSDVSDRVSVESSLRTNERALETVLENCRAAVFLKDKDGKHLLVNSSYEYVLGVARGEAVGKTDCELMEKRYSQISSESDKQVFKTAKGTSYELEVKRPGKSSKVYAVTKVPVIDEKGKVYAVGGFGFDITKRKENEHTLLESEQRLKLSLEAASAGTFVWNCSSGWIEWDARSREILGLTKDQAKSTIAEWLGCIEPNDSRAVCESLEACKKELGRWQTEYRVNGKNSEIRYVTSAGFFTTDPSGQALLTGILLDNTEQKLAQEAIRQAKGEAEQASRAKSHFLATMSHEIRTPMNAIIGMTHLVQRTNLSPKQTDYIKKIEMSAHSLLGIINDVLDFSKVEAGKFSLEQQDFNLAEVFDNLGHTMSIRRGQKDNLEILFSIEPDVPRMLVGDPVRLGQILLNLGVNAIKFTDQGQIEISVRCIHKTAAVVSLEFSVSDTGIGMSEREIANLFRPFNQCDSSASRKFGGTGLGLSICKAMVDLMQGSIAVESAPSKGSRFCIRIGFPISLASDNIRAQFPAQNLLNLPVLVIDENSVSLRILVSLLKGLGCIVTAGTDFEKVIEKQTRSLSDFKLLIVDWKLVCKNPHVTKTIDLLRVKIPNLRVLTTAYLSEDVASLANSIGYSGTIPKPVSEAALVEAVSSALNSQRSARHNYDRPTDGTPHFGYIPVLLVEDNEINRQLASELLEACGLAVTTANSGLEALERVKHKNFQLVLMDVRMPGMDGIEATRQLRRTIPASRLPIVAMTANALSEDELSCKSAGMNDYLTKPIDPEKLYTTLAKYITPETYKFYPHETGVDFPTIHGLDYEAGLRRVGRNQELYVQLLLQFVVQQRGAAYELRSAIFSQDLEKAQRLCHNLKGVAANLGAYLIAGIATDLVKTIHEQDAAKFDDNLDNLDCSLNQMFRSLSLIKKTQPVEEEEPILALSPAELTRQVHETIALLESDLQSAMQNIDGLMNCSNDSSYQIQLKKVQEAAQNFDTDQVSKLLLELSERVSCL